MSAHLIGCGALGGQSVSLITAGKKEILPFSPGCNCCSRPRWDLLVSAAPRLSFVLPAATACRCHFSRWRSALSRSALLTATISPAAFPAVLTAIAVLVAVTAAADIASLQGPAAASAEGSCHRFPTRPRAWSGAAAGAPGQSSSLPVATSSCH